jgi:hypothetical protein
LVDAAAAETDHRDHATMEHVIADLVDACWHISRPAISPRTPPG